ncbi:biotin/lipoyl-binding protein [Pandoraea pulmonicola]|uniref:Efflux pump periplasmic linker BepF n=1 Tax=Pandoraea pulmonicola TaxID=93221 RepID=A0AAJ4Z9F9_PANPU|nr:biotin/lipoyl-binding protein [Pandoraea pulmonicola]AJC21798.1 hypothetical protein RO07_17280 [Pandoraea pulmonicola]SUA89298.1 Efflux pump periplasmic linker BepF [Pandoraea pulmonicola]
MTQPTAPDNAGPEPGRPRPPGWQRRWRWLAFFVLVVVLVAAALLIWRGAVHRAPPPDAAQPPIAVVFTVVAARDLPRYVVQATTSVTVRARVDGQIERVTFSEGRDVKAGDLLVQIDPRPLRAQLDRASVWFRDRKARQAQSPD